MTSSLVTANKHADIEITIELFPICRMHSDIVLISYLVIACFTYRCVVAGVDSSYNKRMCFGKLFEINRG